MTKSPISWVTGDIQLSLPHVLTSYVALSNTRYTPGIHVAWALGNQHDGKALPGRRSSSRRRSMVQGVAGRNKSLACCFCWPSSSDIVTGFRCPSVTIECRTYWRSQAFHWVSINPGRTRNGGLAPHTRSLSSTPSEFAGVSRQGHFSYYLIRLIVLRSWWRQALRHSRERDSLSLISLEREIQTRSLIILPPSVSRAPEGSIF